jgi:hypothetical protein
MRLGELTRPGREGVPTTRRITAPSSANRAARKRQVRPPRTAAGEPAAPDSAKARPPRMVTGEPKAVVIIHRAEFGTSAEMLGCFWFIPENTGP